MNDRSQPISQLRFLIAEDHEFQRNALGWMLAGLGATQIYDAADGREALRILRDSDPAIDIVISDLDMPGMDGMELIRHMGRDGYRASIILASALEPKLLASVGQMAEAYGINLLGVIEKPLAADKLLGLVERHVRMPEFSAIESNRIFTPEELRAGISAGQFQPYFQPKIELRTGRLCGAEALARWIHPDEGVVQPASFIDAFDEHGLIDELTWAIVPDAMAACSEWQRRKIDAAVSVNLSVRSLDDLRFADRMIGLAGDHRVSAENVILEITESATTLDLGHVLENLARLRMYGFGLSIDDYGKGYSSMQQLSRISFTELKIDSSFVAGASRQPALRMILESSLDLARRLGLHSVAEGVETRADLELLRTLGCEMAQGYLFAVPMQLDEWLEWAGTWDPRGVAHS